MKNSKTNCHAPTDTVTNTIAPADINYDDAVRKGKAIVASLSGKQWDLGDLTAQVEKAYGQNRLEQFAVDINFPGAACTLSRYRSVCVAFPKTGGRPLFFGSAQKLQTHPDRHQIVGDNPEITKREAIELMREWRAKQNGTASEADEADDEEEAVDDLEATDTEPSATAEPPATPPSTPAKAKGTKKPISAAQAEFNETKRWVAQDLARANDTISAAQVRHKPYTPKERQNIVKALAAVPASLATMEQANKEDAKKIVWLKELVAEAKEAAEAEGRIKASPKRAASEPAQAVI
jgi:hypothetical protein